MYKMTNNNETNDNKQEMFKEVRLTTEESNRWKNFHEDAYKEDKKMAEMKEQKLNIMMCQMQKNQKWKS
ncbi:hypothetical protein GF327_05160 [Candidatus Woesearchaeota archaeon]|nr:hypothetical protein [Candidatus Woesearchaeota archaeon]